MRAEATDYMHDAQRVRIVKQLAKDVVAIAGSACLSCMRLYEA
jgi:hypothetical protein